MSSPGKKDPKDIVLNSGHRLHGKVAQLLRQSGWTTLVSPYYVDPLSNKPREVDLIAEKRFEGAGHDHRVDLEVRLYVECKRVADTTAFWFDAIDERRAIDLVNSMSPFSIPKLPNYEEHHYWKCGGQVAKLFEGGGKATVFGAITQSLNGLPQSKKRTLQLAENEVHYTMHYPLIVWSSFEDLHKTQFAGDDQVQPISENFLLEVDYATRDNSGNPVDHYFLIDNVSLQTLAAFLGTIDGELAYARQLMM